MSLAIERARIPWLPRAVASTLASASAPLIGLTIVLAVFGWLLPLLGRLFPELHTLDADEFLNAANFRTVAVQTVIVSLAALGATVIIIAGGIDLSPGATVALSSVTLAFWIKAGGSPVSAIAACLLSGLVAGIVNGCAVVSMRLAPFIVTLGTMGIFRGIAGLIARNNAIQAYEAVDQVAPWLNQLASPTPRPAWLIVAPGVWLVPVLAMLVAFFLRRTAAGRYVFAVGSNETAARLCGLNLPALKVFVYALGGVTAGLAGMAQFARTSVGDPSAAEGLELSVIAAVVIGGASLRGGRGSVFGTLLGALLMALLQNGCTKAGLDIQIQKIIVGVIIVAAAALDRLRQGRGAG